MVKQVNIRMGSWSAFWLGVAVLSGAAVLLGIGFAIALVLTLLAGLTLLRSWLRRLWTRGSVPRGPITIEGHCSRTEP